MSFVMGKTVRVPRGGRRLQFSGQRRFSAASFLSLGFNLIDTIMIQNCFFDPSSDIERTVPDLSVDIAEVMASHVVASTGDTTPYSKETEISEVGHYITDKISGAIAALRLGKSMSAAVSSPSVEPSNPEGAKQHSYGGAHILDYMGALTEKYILAYGITLFWFCFYVV